MARSTTSTAAVSGEACSGERADTPARVDDLIVEIVSDSGEGAQKAGQTLGAVSAKMGNGVWTVEIIPAEIRPPARSRAGASGIRLRIGSGPVTNMGDQADLVVAFNEQVLYGRIEQGAYRRGTLVLLESRWASDDAPEVRAAYAAAVAELRARELTVLELPIEQACLEICSEPRLGKNMFVLGMLCRICGRDVERALAEVAYVFQKKGPDVVERNQALVRAGFAFAQQHVEQRFEVPAAPPAAPLVVMNGNQALALGILAAGIEVVAMYPITPATSASHFLAGALRRAGGCLHQAEDEIAAIGFALGASYAGRTACTITSGPGLALKTEFLGLAVMAELPLVLVVVQRGGPATGLPTKVEQGDLLSVLFGCPGDAPKVVLAAATIEECLRFVITARQLAEMFRTPVILLSDANLATGVTPFPRPVPREDWLAPPVDPSPWAPGTAPYDWDPVTGLSPRPIPGQPGGEYVLTGLAHTSGSKVAYDPDSNQRGCEARSRKLRALQTTLLPPRIFGDESGDLLVVGWGSTLGSIEEAVARARADGHAVSSIHLRFLSPLEPGLEEIFARFRQVMTVEINFSDPADDPFFPRAHRRLAQLAWLLRAATLFPVDCWSNVHGQPLRPGAIHEEIVRRCTSRGESREEAACTG